MKWIKAIFVMAALSLSFNSMAMTDDDEMIFKDALTGGDIKVVKKFVKADANVVNEKFFGWAPLQMAANKNQIVVVKYLIANGAELDYVHPNAKHTAFHLAALNRMTDMTTLLAKSGVDVNIKFRNELSLIQFFRDEGDETMMKHLTDLGVKDDGCSGPRCK